ncbi:hypothetical protein ASE69_17060 [Sphingomonas sp. Leaf208]|nr:hypothetical protein ASE69_17060 [Sphingomonas sp. Leaf208]
MIMTNDHHSRSDIVQLAKVENDVLTVWLRQGLIRPIDAGVGRGKSLRFDPYQVRIARVLADGRGVGLNGDALRAIADALQTAIQTFAKADAHPRLLSSIIEEIEAPGHFQDNFASIRRLAANRPSDELTDLLEMYEQDGFEETVKKAAAVFSVEDLDNLWLCVQLFDAEGYLVAYWDIHNGLWKVERHATLDGSRLPSAACILLDLSPLADLPE